MKFTYICVFVSVSALQQRSWRREEEEKLGAGTMVLIPAALRHRAQGFTMGSKHPAMWAQGKSKKEVQKCDKNPYRCSEKFTYK
jgi:hypothetical protein